MKIILFISLFFCISAYSQIEFKFTNPECQAYGKKPKNAFCTRNDLPKAQARVDGVFSKIIELIKSPANKKITLATMTFSHAGVAQALCEVVKKSVQVTVLVDAGMDLSTAMQVEKCGGKVVEVGTNEADDQRGDLHHNKFLLIEKDKESTLVFSTANFSNPGLTINHETWGFVTESKNSVLMQNHKCLIESLKNYHDDITQFKKSLNECRQGLSAPAVVESLFVPADSARIIKLIDNELRTSNQVLMTSNRYSFDRITKAFKSGPHHDNRALFDDDLYWGGLQPTDDYVSEAIDAVKVNALEKVGVPVKFMQTSFGAGQKMHNKFIVFDSLVIVGAGNYTRGGLTSNFENFYVIRDAASVAIFKKQFEYLWSIATTRQQMPKTYFDPGARP